MTESPSTPPPPAAAPRRAARRWPAVVAGVAIAVVLVLVGSLETGFGVRAIANLTLAILHPIPGLTAEVAGARGGVFTGIELHGVRFRDARGALVLGADTLRARYRLDALLGRPLEIRDGRVAGLVLDLRSWPAPPPAKKPGRPGTVLRIERVALERGMVTLPLPGTPRDSAVTVVARTARVRDLRIGRPLTWTLDTLAADVRLPGVAVTGAAPIAATISARGAWESARVRIDRLRVVTPASDLGILGTCPLHPDTSFAGLDLRLDAAPLGRGDLARGLPHATRDVGLRAVARGAGERATLELEALGSDGATVSASAALTRPRRGAVTLRADARARRYDLADLLGGPRGTRVIEARLAADVRGDTLTRLDGPVTVDLAGTRYGGVRLDEAALRGAFTAGRVAFELRGRGAGVTLRGAGAARPFDARPTATLEARVELPPIHAGADTTTRIVDGAVTLVARLDGFRDSTRTGEARLALESRGGAVAVLEGGQATFRWRGAALTASATLAVLGGSAATEAVARLGPEPEYRTGRCALRDLRLSPPGGDPDAPRLDADLILTGRGLDPATLRARLDATRFTLRRGDRTLAHGAARATLDRARLALETDAALDTGRVTLRGTIASILPPGGFSPATLDARAHVELHDARWRGRALVSGVTDATLAHGAVRFDGSLATDAGRGEWHGTARPFDAIPALDVRSLSCDDVVLEAWTRDTTWSGILEARVSGRARGRDLATLTGDARFDLAGSRIHAVTLDRLDGSVAIDRAAWRATVDGASGAGTLTVRGDGLVRRDSVSVDARGRLDVTKLGALVGRDSLPGEASGGFRLTGEIPVSAALAHLDLGLVADGRGYLGTVRVDTLGVAARLRDRVLTVERLDLAGSPLRAHGHGTLPLPAADASHVGAFELAVDGSDLAPFAETFRLTDLATGTLHGRLRITGPADARDATLAFSLLRGRIQHTYIDTLGIAADARIERLRVASAHARAFAGAVIPPGISARDLDATLDWDGAMLKLDAGSTADDVRHFRFGGRVWPDERRAVLEHLELQQLSTPLTLAKPAPIRFDDGWRVDDLELMRDGRRRARLDGGVDSLGRIDLHGLIDRATLDEPMQLVGYPVLGGTLTGQLDVGGTLRAPTAEGTLALALTADRRPLLDADGSMRWRDGRMTAELTARGPRTGTLRYAADLPIILTEPGPTGGSQLALVDGALSMTLTAQRFDLAPFQKIVSPSVARRITGVIDGEARLTGTRTEPRLDGALTVDGAGIELPRSGTRLEKGVARLAFAGRTITLEHASVRSGRGQATASGTLELSRHGSPAIAFQTRLERFQLMDAADGRLAATGDVRLGGTLAAPKVDGELTLQEGVLWVSGSSEAKYETVTLSEDDIRDLRTRFDRGIEMVNESTARESASRTALDLGITIGDGVWLRSRSDPVVALELNGAFRVGQRPGEPLRIAGNVGVTPGGSSVTFMGRRFEVTQAQIALPGEIADARTQIEARYGGAQASENSSDVEVTAFVTVDAQGTTIDLRSRPHLERDAILQFIATGQLPGRVGSAGGSGGDDASALAVGWLLGTMGGAAGQRLGLDVVQVTQDAYGGHMISAGSYVHPRVYLGIREPFNTQSLSSSGPGTATTEQTEFDIGLEAMKRLLVQIQGNEQQLRIFLRPRLGR